MTLEKLTEEDLDNWLKALPGWELMRGGDAIARTFEFADFNEAFGFMTRVALVAEKMDHHPDWSNSWNRVVIGIVNHSAGGVTQQCLDFAIAVEGIYRVTADPAMTPVD